MSKEDQPTPEEQVDTTNEQVESEVPSADQAHPEDLVPAGPTPEQQLAEAQAQAAEYLDGWQRARAELANYKRRVEAQRAEMALMANATLLQKLLPLLDDLELALRNAPSAPTLANPAEPVAGSVWQEWREGVTLIAHKFATVLEGVGVVPIQTEHQFFDPTIHEAVSMEENPDLESGYVIAEVRKGYRLGDRVLRPAMVRVAR